MSTKYKDRRNCAQMEELIELYKMINGKQVTILQDDGFNMNVISKPCVGKYKSWLKLYDARSTINHSYKYPDEETTNILHNTEIQIDDSSNWNAADCR